MRPSARRPLAEILLAASSTLVFLGAAETALRLAGYGPEPPLAGPMYVRSATRGFDLKPGYRGQAERSPYLQHPPIRINALGLRGPEIDARKQPGTFRILCLGDSYMFGWGVQSEEALPARLETLLNSPTFHGGRAQTLNAGVPAYGSDQELDQLLEKGFPLEPDAVVLGYVLNDALPGGDRRPRLDVPFKTALHHSALYRFLGRLYQQGLITAMAEASPAGGRIEDIVAYEKANTETLESGRPDVDAARAESVKAIARMSSECRRVGVPLLVAIFPNRYQVESAGYAEARFDRRLLAELSEAGVRAIDLFPVFKQAAAAGVPLYLPDTHPNAAGHLLAARAVAARLLEITPGLDGGVPR